MLPAFIYHFGMLTCPHEIQWTGIPCLWVIFWFKALIKPVSNTKEHTFTTTTFDRVCSEATELYNQSIQGEKDIDGKPFDRISGPGDLLSVPQVEQMYILAAVTWKQKMQDFPWPESFWGAR